MKQTKKNINKKKLTRKKRLTNDFFTMKKIKNVISSESKDEIKKMIIQLFEIDIQKKIKNCPRPIVEKYGDFLERKKGRFEITPPPLLEKKIWKLLLENKQFQKINKELKEFITKNNTQCIQELCILPVDAHTKEGVWHRDVFIDSSNDFQKKPYYITQIIYLDDKANTEFCLNSQNNSSNNTNRYAKKIIKSSALSSVVFDGRTLHKGLENNTNKIRYAIYISYYDSNYVDKESIKETVLHKNNIC